MSFFFVIAAVSALVPQAPTSFSMELPSPPETPEGQRALAIRAIEFCAGRYPVLGRYEYGATAPLQSVAGAVRYRVRQELTCADTAPASTARESAVAVASDWRATEQDEQWAIAATRAYFRAVDSGDEAGLLAMME